MVSSRGGQVSPFPSLSPTEILFG
ncbi:unnamed protein product, partial [Didymodactylos carnosus]